MIAYLKGVIADIYEDYIVIDVNNIGYNVRITTFDASNIGKIGDDVRIHTFMSVREDDISLFGFLDKAKLELFKMLITVNGIGPKGALAILSGMSDIELRYAIISGDDKAISKAPGVGLKTAQRVILELKNKIAMPDIDEAIGSEDAMSGSIKGGFTGRAKDEVMQALTALGYSASEAIRALQQVVANEDISSEELLKLALKKLI